MQFMIELKKQSEAVIIETSCDISEIIKNANGKIINLLLEILQLTYLLNNEYFNNILGFIDEGNKEILLEIIQTFISTANKQNKEVLDSKSKIEDNEGEVKKLLFRIDNLEDQIEKLNKKVSEKDNLLKEQADGFNTRLLKLNDENKKYMMDITILQEENKKLSYNYSFRHIPSKEDVTEDNSIIIEKYHAQLLELEKYKKEIANKKNIETKLKNVTQELEYFKDQINILDQYKSKSLQLESSLNLKEIENDNLKHEMEIVKNELIKYQDNLKEEREKVNNYELINNGMKLEIEDLRSKIEDLESNIKYPTLNNLNPETINQYLNNLDNNNYYEELKEEFLADEDSVKVLDKEIKNKIKTNFNFEVEMIEGEKEKLMTELKKTMEETFFLKKKIDVVIAENNKLKKIISKTGVDEKFISDKRYEYYKDLELDYFKSKNILPESRLEDTLYSILLENMSENIDRKTLAFVKEKRKRNPLKGFIKEDYNQIY